MHKSAASVNGLTKAVFKNVINVVVGPRADKSLAVLTGYVGPKAFAALQAAGIRVGQGLDSMTVRQAVECYKAGKAEWAAFPNSRGNGR